jgi:predicted CopG family antitoxin
MNTGRLNITLPEDVYNILKGIKNKSSYIAEAVREKRLMEDRENFMRALEAAYREAAVEDFETYKEWEDTLKDCLID